MAIIKAAYFWMCPECFPRHGNIVCADESEVRCFCKLSARISVDEILKRGLIDEHEKIVLLEMIEGSPLPERGERDAHFFPSAIYTAMYPPEFQAGDEEPIGEEYDEDDAEPEEPVHRRPDKTTFH